MIRYLDYLIERAYHRSPEALGAYRFWFAFGLLLLSSIPDFSRVSEVPDFLFTPPLSLAYLWEGWPSVWWLEAITLLCMACAVALCLGYRTRWAGILLTVLLIVGKSFYYSVGKIDHDHILVYLPLVLAFSGWGERASVDVLRREPRPTTAWPIAYLALIFSFLMFTAGVKKLVGGWLSLDTQAVHSWLFNEVLINHRTYLLALPLQQVESVLFWEMLDYVATCFELLFPLAWLFPRVFQGFIFFTIIFHLGNALILNIPFEVNLLFYALFLPDRFLKTYLYPPARRIVAWLQPRRWLVAAAVYLLGFYLLRALMPDGRSYGLISGSVELLLRGMGLPYLYYQLAQLLLALGIGTWAWWWVRQN